MATPKFAKLVCVTGENNNKWYSMNWDGTSSNFNVEYGRIESTVQTGSYPISLWDTKYREKIKKGYKDLTHTVVTEVKDQPVATEEVVKEIEEKKVNIFLTLMKKYTDGLVANTYKVKAKDVTQVQIDEAQKYLNELMEIDKKDVTLVNSKLLELYMVIPRYMGKVQHHLLPNINLDKVLIQEQDNLDAMSSQVSLLKPKEEKKKKKAGKTLLDILGIEMKEQKEIPKEIKYITEQISKTGRKIEDIFKVEKESQSNIFDTWVNKCPKKDTRFLIHGTRTSSVIPILEQGLKIRPSGNYQFSGSVYGSGLYFSETASKSLNYTGNTSDKILFVFEVHVGNSFVYDGWFKGNSFPLDYKNLSERGYHSTFVKAGGGLLNTEIITYTENQNRLKYIIWLK